jgi:hypothetical protein
MYKSAAIWNQPIRASCFKPALWRLGFLISRTVRWQLPNKTLRIFLRFAARELLQPFAHSYFAQHRRETLYVMRVYCRDMYTYIHYIYLQRLRRTVTVMDVLAVHATDGDRVNGTANNRRDGNASSATAGATKRRWRRWVLGEQPMRFIARATTAERPVVGIPRWRSDGARVIRSPVAVWRRRGAITAR